MWACTRSVRVKDKKSIEKYASLRSARIGVRRSSYFGQGRSLEKLLLDRTSVPFKPVDAP